MNTNQTIDGWVWLRRLFWSPPAEPAPEAPKEVDGGLHIGMCGYCIESIDGNGIRLFYDPTSYCGRPLCPVCKGVGPMTPERAAQINQRFLQERGYE